jgi:hypothetical protein
MIACAWSKSNRNSLLTVERFRKNTLEQETVIDKAKKVEELQRKEKHRNSETIEPDERNQATALPHNSMRAEFPFALWTGRGCYYRKIREEMRVEKSWSHRFGAATVLYRRLTRLGKMESWRRMDRPTLELIFPSSLTQDGLPGRMVANITQVDKTQWPSF